MPTRYNKIAAKSTISFNASNQTVLDHPPSTCNNIKMKVPNYLRNYDSFHAARMNYYKNTGSGSQESQIASRIESQTPKEELGRVGDAIEQISSFSPGYVIVTSTKNREDKIISSYNKLCEQDYNGDWSWIVVDNGSSDNTIERLNSLGDRRVHALSYTAITGCAYPVRNYGFDVAALAVKKSSSKTKWIMNIDSDDQLYDKSSLRELNKLNSVAEKLGQTATLIHGFAVWEMINPDGSVDMSSCPANVGSDFPRVERMKDIHERGLIFLASAMSRGMIPDIRYSAEFSFEDDAITQKIMLNALKRGDRWLHTNYPIILKGGGDDSMISRNNLVGDPSMRATIGIGHEVSGIRAQIVTYLSKLRDYYVREGL